MVACGNADIAVGNYCNRNYNHLRNYIQQSRIRLDFIIQPVPRNRDISTIEATISNLKASRIRRFWKHSSAPNGTGRRLIWDEFIRKRTRPTQFSHSPRCVSGRVQSIRSATRVILDRRTRTARYVEGEMKAQNKTGISSKPKIIIEVHRTAPHCHALVSPQNCKEQ